MVGPHQHISLIQEQLRKLLNQPVNEAVIHDLRVTIKKIRALWIIHPIGSTIPFKTSFPNLRKLFKLAAKPRELQMTWHCLNSLPDFGKWPALAKKLKKEIIREQKKLEKWISKHRFRLSIFDELHRFKAYQKVSSGFILKKNRKLLRQKLAGQLTGINPTAQENLHDLRKTLKNFLYQAPSFHSNHEATKHFPSLQHLETIQKGLGTWHDWLMAVKWLETKEKEPATNGHTELLKEARAREIALKREIVRDIRNVLKTEMA